MALYYMGCILWFYFCDAAGRYTTRPDFDGFHSLLELWDFGQNYDLVEN
jgi:hypothetical protein